MVGLSDNAVQGLCAAHADIPSGHDKNCCHEALPIMGLENYNSGRCRHT